MIRRNLSIRWRLAFQFSATVIGILILTGGLLFTLFTTKMRSDIDTLLTVHYENVKNGLSEDLKEGGESRLRASVAEMKSIGLFAIVLDGGEEVLVQSLQEELPLPTDEGFFSLQHGDNLYRLLTKKYGSYLIVVGQNQQTYLNTKRLLLSVLLITLALSAFASFLLSFLFAGRAIRPLKDLHRRVASIDVDRLPDDTLAESYPGDEIGKLAQEFDVFLKRLREAFAREKRFTQDASHELRTPLMLLKSSLELVSGKPVAAEDREKLSLMEDAVGRMERLTNDLLFLSRGMKSQEREKVDVAAFVSSFVEQFKPMAEEKGLKLETKILGKPVLKTHPLALEKVLGNFIRNAVAFTDRGSVEIVLQGDSITIADTGRGIAASELPHIFERLYRAESSRKNGKVAGFGLGLAIVKQICTDEGWKIDVKSEEGKGTRFVVTFHR